MTDPNHFEVFMKNYQDMVYATAVRLLGNEADAEDISQAVFLKAYESFGQLSQSPTVGGWLKTVATNLSLNHLSRYRARWRFFSEMRSEESEQEFIDTLPAPNTVEQGVAETERQRLLEEALRKLPAAQRVPLVLFHFEGLRYEEIAARLKTSLSKIKTDIHRGRLALARYVNPGLLDERREGEKFSSPAQSNKPAARGEPPRGRPSPSSLLRHLVLPQHAITIHGTGT